ncbi:lipoprotein [Spiroplasma citri]|uniref:Hypothetical lipoprotein transmembrane n=1 Tax=Spiroplasma citri TaxID=2133 RepID=Q14NG4_SPICI|nr:lipoprotein [Spiroplasma citri]APE74984.1 putative lipoprotein [Spiroplasma citri]QIA67231.1 hypothetical protein GMI18_06050 [Spiroplasma citri]QIA69142.1 hypothetical protein GL298_06305 [Spiroplasma citri]QIA71008.1 lipoprotein [Spiroplasma citri]QIA73009.1 lipoprotein [Spiroplasma citri]
MKKWLSFLGAITLLGTSTTSLVACNNIPQYNEDELQQLKKENQIYTNCQEIKENLEWICPQEKPFNQVDNKWYYVIWREDNSVNWKIDKFKNNRLEYIKINKINDYEIGVSNNREENRVLFIFKENKEIVRWNWWNYNNKTFFKSVYRWNLYFPPSSIPNLIIDDNGNVKVNSE